MVDVVRPSWISKLEPFNGMWHLSENGKPSGQFDAIVIAHNGQSFQKCLYFTFAISYILVHFLNEVKSMMPT